MMNRKILLGLILALCLPFVFGTVCAADEPYAITLSDAYHYADETENWACEVTAPEISGMADETAQSELNERFLSAAKDTVAGYETDVKYMEESFTPDMYGHFAYYYSYSPVYENETRLVFKTEYILQAGSSNVLTQYFNIDKTNGSLITKDELFASEEFMTKLEVFLRGEMEKENEKESMYWLDDDTLHNALGYVCENDHWYIDEEDHLVIWFDKYEVAPGAQGCSAWVIPDDLVK